MNRFGKYAALAAVGTLAFTACGGGTTTSGSSSSTSTSTSTASGDASTGGADAAAAALACPSGKLVGGGSTAQKLAMETLTSDYASECGNKGTIEYSGTGSGQGIKDFYNKQIDFAGSDSALKSKANSDGVIEVDKATARCGGNPAWNLPMVVGPISFAYNLEGLDNLVLTPAVVADIFNGKITTWNDKAIADLNKDATLPSDKISVFFRSDESGTSENVQKYLAAAATSNWKAEPAKKWAGASGEGKKGSQGVAEGISGTKGGFGYIEWKYAKDSQLGVAAIDNGDGPVELSAESAGKAVESAEVTGTGNDLGLKLKYTENGAGAYPVILVTYEIACSKGLDADKTALLKDYLSYMVSTDVQEGLPDLGYAPLPESLRTKVETAVQAIS